MNNFEVICDLVAADSDYRELIAYGEPRPGHPEGSIEAHIEELEANLDRLRDRLTDEEYHKLRFLVHVHDTFKGRAQPGVAISHPQSHASLARQFAARFTGDPDLLAMVQYHDEGYALWRRAQAHGAIDEARFERLLGRIADWRLFLILNIVDGCTEGKDRERVGWFLRLVNARLHTGVDESWLL